MALSRDEVANLRAQACTGPIDVRDLAISHEELREIAISLAGIAGESELTEGQLHKLRALTRSLDDRGDIRSLRMDQ